MGWVMFASGWDKTWAIKGLTENACCSLNQGFPTLTCTRTTGESVQMLILIHQVEGRTLPFSLAARKARNSRLYVTVFTGVSQPPPDGSMSTSCGSCCPSLSVGPSTRSFAFFSDARIYGLWSGNKPSPLKLSLWSSGGSQLLSALCSCWHL